MTNIKSEMQRDVIRTITFLRQMEIINVKDKNLGILETALNVLWIEGRESGIDKILKTRYGK